MQLLGADSERSSTQGGLEKRTFVQADFKGNICQMWMIGYQIWRILPDMVDKRIHLKEHEHANMSGHRITSIPLLKTCYCSAPFQSIL